MIASGARDRPKANAVGRKKQAGCARETGRQDGHSLPSHHKITFWSGNFTPCRVVLPLGDGRQYSQAQTKRVSSLRFQQFRLPGSKESGVRWGENGDVAVIFFAPPFYVSKWRIGRCGWSSRYPDSKSLPSIPIHQHCNTFKSATVSFLRETVVAS